MVELFYEEHQEDAARLQEIIRKGQQGQGQQHQERENILAVITNNDAQRKTENNVNSNSNHVRSLPIIYINGSLLPSTLLSQARPSQTLLDFLRNVCHLTGTKLGCGEGGCGACTVLISRWRSHVTTPTKFNTGGFIEHVAVNACLFPVLAADGCHVTTIEGVGRWKAHKVTFNNYSNNIDDKEDYLHPIQQAMVDMHGSQCGFCTPGIIMALYGLFAPGSRGNMWRNGSNSNNGENGTTEGVENYSTVADRPPLSTSELEDSSNNGENECTNSDRYYSTVVDGPPLTITELEEHMDGNLCRCTGYRPIWDAARSLCVASKEEDEPLEEEGMKGPCGMRCRECPEKNACELDFDLLNKMEGLKVYPENTNSHYFSSTATKVYDYRQVIQSKYSNRWWNQPNEMFPKELLPNSGSELQRVDKEEEEEGSALFLKNHKTIEQALSTPLVVTDTTINNGEIWYQPTTLEEMLNIFREYSTNSRGLKMVVGNTEVGIETKFRHASYSAFLHPTESIHTLFEIFSTLTHFNIGACSSLSALQQFCHEMIRSESVTLIEDTEEEESKQRSEQLLALSQRRIRTAKPIHDMLRWFASTQIRNVACLGGNLATASPISDMNPLLAAMNGIIVLASRPSSDGGISRRHVQISDFFIAYRQVDLSPIEVIERIEVPILTQFEYVVPFKQARRREDDISIVTSGMRIKISPVGSSWIIHDISIAFGGLAPKTVMANHTMKALIGGTFEEVTFVKARAVLQKEFRLPDNVPGGQAQYRLTLACSFLHKFFLHCARELKKDIEASSLNEGHDLPPIPILSNDELCGAVGFLSVPKPSICGSQRFPVPKVATGLEAKHFSKNGQNDIAFATSARVKDSVERKTSNFNSVGEPVSHASGPLHCTGEAEYTDDIPTAENLLHGTLVMASKCNARLVSIDISPAFDIHGVYAVFTHDDIVKIGGDNHMGPILLDDVAFLPIGEKVAFVGQVIGICLAISQDISEKGARAVVVKYDQEDEGKTAIVSIEDAIKAGSFWTEFRHEIKRGEDVDHILRQTEIDGKRLVVVEGSTRTGGQEHFYLEPNTTLAIPSESATNLTIYASTQAPTKTQDFCARVTNTPAAKVVVKVKRMGGGFGGKETRSVFCSVAAALAAKLTNRPVRLTLNRDTDMSITGGRHPFLAYYKAGALVDEHGSVKLHAVDITLYNNGGSKFDLSGPVMDRALFHVDNCYFWPNFRSVGTPCKTCQTPHTAFRGFGGPQGMAVAEHIMDHIALACNVSADRLRRENMYTVQDCTPFGMRFGGPSTGKWNVPSMWDRLYAELDVPRRRAAAAEFNANNKWVKRGVGFIPTKFGIAFTAKYMNQGGALVHLYTDGTVLVSHGGTEMGQGLHTKVCQVAAQAFGIPLSDVYVNDSSTASVANTIPSAASMSTDLYGMATLDACQQILKRIQPVRDQLPHDSKLSEVAKKAFFDRVDLSAHGFFAIDNDRCGYDWNKSVPEDYPTDLPENSWKGHPFNYFTQGVALAEVEVDLLTGDHKTLCADILVDVGSSINPAIDIGQIEGAFIQGMGWSTMEEVVYADDDHTWIRPRAKVFTTGPGTYKIPSFNDIPENFNVSLLEDGDNPFAVHSSKAVGEPPFFLGCSVFYAIKDAVTAARSFSVEKGGDRYFEFRMPATSERIRMACGDVIVSECVADVAHFQPKGSF